MKKGKLVVISGPSGVGKSSLAKEVIQRTGAKFSVSATTRPPRQGEVDGRDYYFVDPKTFDAWVREGKLLEWAEVFSHRYGTPLEPVRKSLEKGEIIILDIDVQGGRQVSQKMPEATFILVIPPDSGELARRLQGRGSETQEQLQRRLARAEAEISEARALTCYNHVVVNDDLETAVEQVVSIVQSE